MLVHSQHRLLHQQQLYTLLAMMVNTSTIESVCYYSLVTNLATLSRPTDDANNKNGGNDEYSESDHDDSKIQTAIGDGRMGLDEDDGDAGLGEDNDSDPDLDQYLREKRLPDKHG